MSSSTFKEKINTFVSSKRNILGIYILLSFLAAIQSYTLSSDLPTNHTKYNNYQIFKESFNHLKAQKDLYVFYPDEYYDLFKYTPTFAFFYGVFNLFPDWLGLIIWNLINALVFILAIYELPRLNNYQKGLIGLITLTECLTSLQNEQSNALLAGLLIFSLCFMEKRNYLLATLMIACSFYLKLFGLVGAAIFLFYPQKLKTAGFLLFWLIVLFAVPLLFIDLNQYAFLGSSYLDLLQNDHSNSYGYSVLGWLNAWFNLQPDKLLVMGTGVVLFLIAMANIKQYKDYAYRLLTLSSILLWVVIFNHKAESPTFIIAMAGVAIWYVISSNSKIELALFISALIFTALFTTDILPKSLRNTYIKPYVLKAVPCIFIWIRIFYQMLIFKAGRYQLKTNSYIEQDSKEDAAQ